MRSSLETSVVCSQVPKNELHLIEVGNNGQPGVQLDRDYMVVQSGNLQSHLSTTRLKKLTVVFEYCEARKLTVVFEYYEAKETYSRIGTSLLVIRTPNLKVLAGHRSAVGTSEVVHDALGKLHSKRVKMIKLHSKRVK